MTIKKVIEIHVNDNGYTTDNRKPFFYIRDKSQEVGDAFKVKTLFRYYCFIEANPDIRGTFLCFLMPVPSPDQWKGLRQEGHQV